MSVGWLVCPSGKKVTRVTVVTVVEVGRVPMVNMDTIVRDTIVEVTMVAVIVMAPRAKKLARKATNLESGSGGA